MLRRVAREKSACRRRRSEKTLAKSDGWGTWIRTKINGVRVRCSTVELSPTKAFEIFGDFGPVLQSASSFTIFRSRAVPGRLSKGPEVSGQGLAVAAMSESVRA